MHVNVSPSSPTLRNVRHQLNRAQAHGGITVRVVFGRPDRRGNLTNRGYVGRMEINGRLHMSSICETAAEAVESWMHLHGHLLDSSRPTA